MKLEISFTRQELEDLLAEKIAEEEGGAIVGQSGPYQLEGSPLKVGDRVIKDYGDGDEVAGTVRGFNPYFSPSGVLINYDDGVKGVGTPMSTLRREPLPDVGGFRVGDRITDSGWFSMEPLDSPYRNGTVIRLDGPGVVVDWDNGAKGLWYLPESLAHPVMNQ